MWRYVVEVVLQRGTRASVDGERVITGQIEDRLMLFVGFGQNDSEKEADYLARKLAKLRIFHDDEERMNLSVKDIGGKLLLVPQFTLYAHTKKNRPSFHTTLSPDKATLLFVYFVEKCREQDVEVETGIFGAFMKVDLLNNGPVTIILEKEYDEEN